jgi:hypothetical protein
VTINTAEADPEDAPTGLADRVLTDDDGTPARGDTDFRVPASGL